MANPHGGMLQKKKNKECCDNVSLKAKQNVEVERRYENT